MKSISWYIVCIAYVIIFVYMHVQASDVFGYEFTRPSRTNAFSDYVFAENKKSENLLIFKMDKPDYGPSSLIGATIGGVLGLMFAQYKYPVIGSFPHKVKRCMLIGGALGAATCAIIKAYLLQVFIIDVNLSADKWYNAVSGEYKDKSLYGPDTLVKFAVLWIATAKGGRSVLNDDQFRVKKIAQGHYYSGDIKKNREELLKILSSVM